MARKKPEYLSGLSDKHASFVIEYLDCMNATEAYCRVYKDSTRRSGRMNAARLITNDNIRDAIEHGMAGKAMSKSEVLSRFTAHARGDMSDFMDLDGDSPRLDLSKAIAMSQTSLIRELDQTERVVSRENEEVVIERKIKIKLYDAQAALDKLAKYHQLFSDGPQVDVSIDVSAMTDEQLRSLIDG